jgi:hypothetical protein
LGVPSQLFQQLPWYGQLALTLLSEQQQGSASKWADYIRTLPAAVDAPVLWSEADVAQLQCPYFIQQVNNWGAVFSVTPNNQLVSFAAKLLRVISNW